MIDQSKLRAALPEGSRALLIIEHAEEITVRCEGDVSLAVQLGLLEVGRLLLQDVFLNKPIVIKNVDAYLAKAKANKKCD